VRVRVAASFEVHRDREDDQHDRRHIAECRAAEEPDVRKKRAERARDDRRRESESQLAREKVDSGEDEHAGDEIDRLQRAKIIVNEQAHELRRGDIDRKSRRMRMMTGHVIRTESEAEKDFVPIPQRARYGEKARRRAEKRDDPEDETLVARQRRGGSAPIDHRRSGAKDLTNGYAREYAS